MSTWPLFELSTSTTGLASLSTQISIPAPILRSTTFFSRLPVPSQHQTLIVVAPTTQSSTRSPTRVFVSAQSKVDITIKKHIDRVSSCISTPCCMLFRVCCFAFAVLHLLLLFCVRLALILVVWKSFHCLACTTTLHASVSTRWKALYRCIFHPMLGILHCAVWPLFYSSIAPSSPTTCFSTPTRTSQASTSASRNSATEGTIINITWHEPTHLAIPTPPLYSHLA